MEKECKDGCCTIEETECCGPKGGNWPLPDKNPSDPSDEKEPDEGIKPSCCGPIGPF